MIKIDRKIGKEKGKKLAECKESYNKHLAKGYTFTNSYWRNFKVDTSDMELFTFYQSHLATLLRDGYNKTDVMAFDGSVKKSVPTNKFKTLVDAIDAFLAKSRADLWEYQAVIKACATIEEVDAITDWTWRNNNVAVLAEEEEII